jgi:hypothetical protein
MADVKDLSGARIAELRREAKDEALAFDMDDVAIDLQELLALLAMAERSVTHEQEAVELLRYQLRWSSLDWLAWGTKKRARQAARWIARELDSAPTRKRAKKR